MSVSEPDQGAPILPGSALARRLDDFAVPGLSAGFADRVLSAAEARPPATLAPLPQLRRAPRSRRSWRLGRGIAIGVASFGLLATAAAALHEANQILGRGLCTRLERASGVNSFTPFFV